MAGLGRILGSRGTPQQSDGIIVVPNTLIPVITLPEVLSVIQDVPIGTTPVNSSFLCSSILDLGAPADEVIAVLAEGIWDIQIIHNLYVGTVSNLAGFTSTYLMTSTPSDDFFGTLSSFQALGPGPHTAIMNFRVAAAKDNVLTIGHDVTETGVPAVGYSGYVTVLGNRLA